jgi:hypothetical protein
MNQNKPFNRGNQALSVGEFPTSNYEIADLSTLFEVDASSKLEDLAEQWGNISSQILNSQP